MLSLHFHKVEIVRFVSFCLLKVFAPLLRQLPPVLRAVLLGLDPASRKEKNARFGSLVCLHRLQTVKVGESYIQSKHLATRGQNTDVRIRRKPTLENWETPERMRTHEKSAKNASDKMTSLKGPPLNLLGANMCEEWHAERIALNKNECKKMWTQMKRKASRDFQSSGRLGIRNLCKLEWPVGNRQSRLPCSLALTDASFWFKKEYVYIYIYIYTHKYGFASTIIGLLHVARSSRGQMQTVFQTNLGDKRTEMSGQCF